MTDVGTPLPIRRPELLVTPLGDEGKHVVKDRASGDYFHLGAVEAFLLEKLDGQHLPAQICADFEARFDDPLTEEELGDFVELARTRGFLAPAAVPPLEPPEPSPLVTPVAAPDAAPVAAPDAAPAAAPAAAQPSPPAEPQVATPPPAATPSPAATPPPATAPRRQSILYWRKNVFDPDRLFNWLEPKIRFLWTRTFLASSVVGILGATVVVWANGQQLVTQFASAWRWETLVMAWLTMIAVTTCHEFAHGLTCKRYGGEVHEIGFLLMFFMPCFYCNVSDAWLFREKSKRLWVTLAGAYCDLCIWALAVFIWRMTYQDSLVNFLAWVVMSVAGIRVFFNFNPLIKLDGYYLLSDALEIPNMRQRSVVYALGHLRWLLWGASRPEAQPRGRFLLSYGLLCWLFSLVFVTLMLVGLGRYVSAFVGPAGFAVPVVLGVMVGRGLLAGLFAGEVTTMVWKRHVRTVVWATAICLLTATLFLIPWTDRAKGTFEVRPVTHREIRAPVSAFLDQVHYDEGEEVSEGALIAQLSIPDLSSRIAQKEAELREAKAKLKVLHIGPRPEEIVQQRRHVERSQAWRDVTAKDLTRQVQSLGKELTRFDKQMAEYQAERDYAKQRVAKLESLSKKAAISEDELLEARKKHLVCQAQYERTLAEKEARASLGTRTAESELAEREKELVVEQSRLVLLEAGNRPEEIEAAEASVARLNEESRYLSDLEQSLSLCSPVRGLIITPRLKEMIGTYFPEGELICEIEDPQTLEVVITLDEEQAAKVRAGQTVRLKARALPFEIFEAEVERIAPRALAGDLQSTVAVYCQMRASTVELRSGMTGHARIVCTESPLGVILVKRCLQLIRTEFWW